MKGIYGEHDWLAELPASVAAWSVQHEERLGANNIECGLVARFFCRCEYIDITQ